MNEEYKFVEQDDELFSESSSSKIKKEYILINK